MFDNKKQHGEGGSRGKKAIIVYCDPIGNDLPFLPIQQVWHIRFKWYTCRCLPFFSFFYKSEKQSCAI